MAGHTGYLHDLLQMIYLYKNCTISYPSPLPDNMTKNTQVEPMKKHANERPNVGVSLRVETVSRLERNARSMVKTYLTKEQRSTPPLPPRPSTRGLTCRDGDWPWLAFPGCCPLPPFRFPPSSFSRSWRAVSKFLIHFFSTWSEIRSRTALLSPP